MTIQNKVTCLSCWLVIYGWVSACGCVSVEASMRRGKPILNTITATAPGRMTDSCFTINTNNKHNNFIIAQHCQQHHLQALVGWLTIFFQMWFWCTLLCIWLQRKYFNPLPLVPLQRKFISITKNESCRRIVKLCYIWQLARAKNGFLGDSWTVTWTDRQTSGLAGGLDG